jgi:hypothetical protein
MTRFGRNAAFSSEARARHRSTSWAARLERHFARLDQIKPIGWLAFPKNNLIGLKMNPGGLCSHDRKMFARHSRKEWMGL